jgi:hypothetical protein
LDEVEEGAVDGGPENRLEAVYPESESVGPEVRSGVVPGTPEAPQKGAARSDSAEASGTLRVLRNIA